VQEHFNVTVKLCKMLIHPRDLQNNLAQKESVFAFSFVPRFLQLLFVSLVHFSLAKLFTALAT